MRVTETTSFRVSLSFIDVISCGLGAAVLLFLIYASMPRDVGASAFSGQSALAANELRRGTLSEQKIRGVAVAVRSVKVVWTREGELPRVRWSNLADDCIERLQLSARDLTFVAICSGGLSPSRRARLEVISVPSASEMILHRAVGLDGPLWMTCSDPIALTVGSAIEFITDVKNPVVNISGKHGWSKCSEDGISP